MAVDLQELSRRLFQTANQLWTNTALRPDQYAQPVLALIALRQMEAKFDAVHADLAKTFTGRLKPTPGDYQGRGAVFLPDNARFSFLLGLPETENLAEALNEAMKGIAEFNPDLAGVMPQGYGSLPNSVLRELLRLLAPLKIEGDAYGLIFEYFMGEFASAFMQKGGEYFTPSAIVKLIAEVIEPYHGKIFDPACGSGGMFVQSAEFVRRHHKSPSREISIYGIEKMEDTQKLCRLNLAVHGLSGDVRVANAYYEDPHGMVGKFDFVVANPPFNQSEVDRARLVNEAGKVDARFSLGIPTTNNANYLWIGLFNAALNEHGRAGFVMANSASDAGGSEREMRRKLIETGAVDVIISTSPNMFFTVTLPVTLWFLDKGKAKGGRSEQVLFIDAKNIFRQIDRAHRDFTPDQIEFLGNIVRMWRGEDVELLAGSGPRMTDTFGDDGYKNVLGLCKVVTRAEIAAQAWSLNPGRYVGVAPGKQSGDEDFRERLEVLQEELDIRGAEQAMIRANAQIGEAIANFYPRIGLSTLFGIIGLAGAGPLNGSSSFWRAGGNLSGPIFTGGRLESVYRHHQAFWDETVAQYKQTILVAFRETSDALVAQQRLAERRAALETQVVALRQSIDLALERYHAGRASYFEVIQAQQELFPAEDELAQVQQAQLVAVVNLYKALGGGWNLTDDQFRRHADGALPRKEQDHASARS